MADDNGSPITSYKVYSSPNSGAYVLVGESPVNSFSATGLSMGNNYKFKVMAVNLAG